MLLFLLFFINETKHCHDYLIVVWFIFIATGLSIQAEISWKYKNGILTDLFFIKNDVIHALSANLLLILSIYIQKYWILCVFVYLVWSN